MSSQQAALDPATETPPNPTETEENPDSEEKTEPLPRMLPNQDSTEPIAIPRPPPQTLCLRACNKAQMCGTASGSVAACVTACLASLEATDGDGKQQAIGFRAQERCADKACNLFEDCVGRVLVGERALAEAPPLSPNEAAQRCDRLCKKEQECSPERFSQRPGGMSTCLSTCANMLISPADDIAVRRVLMNKAYGCLDKPCDEFQPCVQSAMTAR